jgi:hypothetical protein
MIRLRGAHRGERALVIFGGPSLLARGFDFSRIRELGCVTFLESKALTPGFLATGIVPDYFLAFYPDKLKDHSLQHFVFRSFLAQYRIDELLQRRFQPVPREMRAKFDEYFEAWRPQRGAHKRYRYHPDVYLPDSPYELLARLPQTKVLINDRLMREHFPSYAYHDQSYFFDFASDGEQQFDAARYFEPLETDAGLRLRGFGAMSNSAALALYPLLAYLGFAEAYFIGMDMSLLGSMELAAPFTFKSMAHFWWFMLRNGRVFSANYRRNGWLMARPQHEFDDLRGLWRRAPMRFTRVYEPWRYAARVDGISTCSYDELWQQGRR